MTTVAADEKTLVFEPTGDAYVDEGSPKSNFGRSTSLEASLGTTQKHAYLKFDVTDLDSASRAVLRVFVTDDTLDAPAVYTTSATWDEGTITWGTRPPAETLVVNGIRAPSGSYFEYDLSRVVTGVGSYGFVMVPDSTDSFTAVSREGEAGKKAVLVVIGPTASSHTFTCEDRFCCMEKGANECETSFLIDPLDTVAPHLSSDGKCRKAESLFDSRFMSDWDYRKFSGYTADPDVFCIAPHGVIEPGTQILAQRCKDLNYRLGYWSFYGVPSLECRSAGVLRSGNGHFVLTNPDALHVTSTKYNYAPLLDEVKKYKTVISFHGKDQNQYICVGGGSEHMRTAFRTSWNATHADGTVWHAVDAVTDSRCDKSKFGGTDPSNPTNKGSSTKGLQLELPLELRKKLTDPGDPDHPVEKLAFDTALNAVVDKVKTDGP